MCSIDPSIHPVWHERGGEKTALDRWHSFFEKGLSGYARRRNNAADPTGVSRLSAAFHYGFLSPMLVARQAAALGTKSAEKYLDELLIFREHPWHHIYASSDPYSSSNLPEWALHSWRETSDDPRVVRLKDHQMEYAESPLELWNLCQHSLLRHGELHNNLRMTWGKAIPLWTESLEHSLYIGQVLNDKYALDGRDPSSVVGIQWCHGLFDRPFFPSIQVMGVVRKRDVVTHSTRLDIGGYETHIHRNQSYSKGPHYVLGNDIVSSCIARMLHDHGLDVQMVTSESKVADESKIDALDTDSFPSWLEQRVASICEDSSIRSVADVAEHMRIGLTNIDAIPEGKEGVVIDVLAQPTSSKNNHLAMKIDHAVWQTVEVLWDINASVKPNKTSVQTRLI
tara:strand:- start:83 stop:1270 length:1188 start_codon:yes stop_codon:yes gene_type:complete